MTGIIVAGMHRSGTSLMAQMLAAGGYHPGDELLVGPSDEYFEDASFVALHRQWLAASVPAGEGHPDWGVSDGGVVDCPSHDPQVRHDQAVSASRFVLGRNGEQDRWVAKDPRASLFLPVWAEVTGVRFVFVYRNPWDVVDSAVRLGAEVFCRHPGLARQAWLDYNARIAAFVADHRDRCMVVAAELLALDPARVWQELDQWVGMSGDVPAGLVDPARFVRRDDAHPIAGLYRHLYPDHMAVLDQLDAAADLPRVAPVLAHDATWSPPVVPGAGGSLPAGTGVQIVIACRDDGDFLAEAIASVDQCGHDAAELTVVDDGSTDAETLRVLDALRSSGRHVISTPGVGLSAARNLGVATSATCVVLPLDADNRVCASLLDAVGAIEDGDVDIVHGTWRRFGMESSVVSPPDITLGNLIPGNTVDACALIRRELLGRVGGWDPQLPFWEDWDLWIGVMGAGARTLRLDEVTFEYLVRPGALNAVALTDPSARQRVVAQIMAKHAAVVGPLVGRLVESVHQFDIAARESDRARRSLEAQHDELVAQHDELVAQHDELVAQHAGLVAQHDGLMQRHDQLVEGYAALDQRVEDLAVLADRREADVGRLTVELEAVRSRRVVRGVDRLASLLRGLRR